MIYDLMELKINHYWFFYRLIPEGGLPSEKPDSVKKVIFCTGKVYYDLTKARAAGELESDIAISRVEQICPFPFDLGTYRLDAVTSSGILKAKQKLGVNFNSDKLGGIDFTKFSKLRMCSAGAGRCWLVQWPGLPPRHCTWSVLKFL